MTTAIKPHNPVMDDYEWRLNAKCVGTNPDEYDLRGDVANKARVARELCSGCPVIAECAADALQAPSVGLVRAGLYIPEIAGSHSSYTPVWEKVLTAIAAGEA